MTKAKFNGGPIDGQEIHIPLQGEFLTIDVSDALPGPHAVITVGFPGGNTPAEIQGEDKFPRFVIGSVPPHTRYTLHFTDKHGVAHYYVPASTVARTSPGKFVG